MAALSAAVTAAMLGAVSVELATTTFWPGLGGLVVVIQGAWLTAVVVAAQEALRAANRRAGRAVGVLAAVALGLVPLVGIGWFVLGGESELEASSRAEIPAYMEQSSALGPAHGVLILEGSVEDGITYSVRRGDGTTTGDDEIEALTPEDDAFTAEVQTLVSRPTTGVADGLADQGIEYVLLSAPADGRVAATLDATEGLAQASTEDRTARAWQVEKELNPNALAGPDSWVRTLLLTLQGLAVVVVLVLCGPTRRRDR
jgi:hypothetical protein